ncbi:hypothetical protein D7319_05700 [Streptomyces radicis]|uniref:DUF6745 domain-containing protein n=1 Tax=Streptomyces radicis TaxID=1750517 RepID=A0A3A9WZI4_9ACTN|nr:hypothetical protein D7319_05700 [Streptomyces radicis]RKN26830.1 hypothetical protein D7318_03960 [Streptomyces radicis]
MPDTSRQAIALAHAVRDEWLGHGLATLPADRARAEAAVTELYRRLGQPPPRFLWTASPVAAVAAVRGSLPDDAPASRLRQRALPVCGPDLPVAGRLASLCSGLRHRLRGWAGRGWAGRGSQPRGGRGEFRENVDDPEAALRRGTPLFGVVDTVVHTALRASLADAVRAPLRMALLPAEGPPPGLNWHGQHDAFWIARADLAARLGGRRQLWPDSEQVWPWAELARSTGWWWPGPALCVMAERPVETHTEPLRDGGLGGLRLHRDDGPAVRFGDGEELYALHGTPVPRWVVDGPTPELIHGETNVEVRRTAIERLGWDRYIDEAGLRLVSTAADPGNPGSFLSLYDVPPRVWGASARLVVATNGSVEPDGRRRRYGLAVPGYFDDPVAAAGWTYGLTGPQYAQLQRRT